jgi:hypothetical protein
MIFLLWAGPGTVALDTALYRRSGLGDLP